MIMMAFSSLTWSTCLDRRYSGFVFSCLNGSAVRSKVFSSCKAGRVAQLGEHLLCKHVVISPKLNRRILTVQTPLQVGLLIGLHVIKDTLSKFGLTL